jgi:oligopeptide transport system substrate-binding protein
MRGLPRGIMFLGTAVSLALVATACGGGDSADKKSGAASGGKVTIANTKPQHPLIPADTNEVGGGNVIDALFTGLVTYDPNNANPVNAVAKSIESTDNTKWTIKLNDGWKFHDGTPVTAKSFVDAWNYSAYGPNALQNAYFFGPIDGFTDVQGEDKNKDEKITADEAPIKTMKGLKVVDDSTFEVTLSTPSSVFPVMVGYTAFSPLPESFFQDPKAFGVKPVGNGPFKLVSGNGDTGYTLTAVSDYKGPDKPKVKDVVFKTYQSPEAQYADLLANNVDFVEQVPPSALADDKYKSDLQNRAVNKPVGIIQTADVPIYRPEYKSPDLHKAISLAINRPLITKQIFNGGRTPATGWVSPVVNGYQPGACGEFCTYDPAKAKEFLQKAGGFQGVMSFAYNADGAGNKEAAEAICNSIKGALGVDCRAKPYVDFATLRTDVDDRKMTGLFRAGWQMDYPSIENFLVPLYTTKAPSNDVDFSDPKFDALTKEAAALKGDEANAKYQEAEKILAEDLASIPLWYQAQQSGWSTKIDNVKVTPFGTLDLSGVTVK